MKGKIIKNLLIFLLANILILLHFSWRLIFAFPWDLLNIIMLAFLWLIIFNPREKYILIASYAVLICDLFYISNFGIESFSQITALLLSNWLLLNFFTNRSLVTVFLTGFFTMVIYRIAFMVLMFVSASLGEQLKPNWIYLIKNFSAEALVTTIALCLIFLFSSIFIKRLRPEYISERQQLL
jgi:hypothetical protein